jgi:signal peptidase I
VYFINQFFFQNYVIPSSVRWRKSLLTGDYLFVSEGELRTAHPADTAHHAAHAAHAAHLQRASRTSSWPHWDYRRVKGFGNVKLNDIVVFNYPSGDSLFSNEQWQSRDYYQNVYLFGEQIYAGTKSKHH